MNLAFDIGGLSTKYLVVDNNKKVIYRNQYKYPNLINEKQIQIIINQIFHDCNNSYSIDNICISTLGIVDPLTGSISGLGGIANYNLVNWKTFFAKLTNAKIYIENDANCAALYELDVDPTIDNALVFVIGTGIGGSIILNHQLYRGKHNMAGEFGCGLEFIQDNQFYNLSSQGSTYSVTQRYYKKTLIEKDGFTIFKLYAHDKYAKESIDEMIYYCAKTIVNSSLIFDPSAIIIGGGVSANSLFYNLLNQKIEELSIGLGVSKMFKLRLATKNNDANLYGALTLLNPNDN